MKRIFLLLTLTVLSTSALAEEKSWFDSVKSFVGLEETKDEVSAEKNAMAEKSTVAAAKVEDTTATASKGLVDMLTSSLNVDSEQASGGMGAIFNYVKGNVSADQFGQLAEAVPNMDGLLDSMPAISSLSGDSSEGLGGLLNQASEYSDTLKMINTVKSQFEALGLDSEMISQFVSVASSYFDSNDGADAKNILTEGLGKLLG
ncbi:DUF2780 domain-containing protein [Colwellia sp. E2M01]|uniref:DUF2780 domain-containing protein n=1 Tax=Colwellia sp. E2M01 TaxID=2841561 RepID=UPI001C096DEF|nr:DUF2780 domain-containing protein [Colwellia sp. E2M01]MBU2869513.1 DUF2780 domain-containing protein [Colwellia sp. E2M01]